MNVRICAYKVGACVGTREENQFFYHTLPYSLETRSLRKPEDNTLTRMPGWEVPVISLSPPANTGFIACASLPDLYMVAENSNTIPHAGTASPLAHGAISSVLPTHTPLGLENTSVSVIYHMLFTKPKDFSKMLMNILEQYWQ